MPPLKSDQGEVTERAGTIIWDLQREAPELLKCLPESAAQTLSAIREGGLGFVARTASPFDGPSFFRPSRHVRAFYQRVPDWNGGEEAVVAYKGSEVWSHDLGPLAAQMSEGRSCLNRLDIFVMKEGKTPFLYLTHEALRDATKAAQLFRAVRTNYPHHPRLPLPLCVISWSAPPLQEYLDTVSPHLSPTARDMVKRCLTDGVAEYVYFYPGAPTRLRHLAPREREALLADWGQAQRLVDSWVTLFTQILCSGYVPVVLSNQNTGCILQDQNVCLDGGMVDVDSVERIADDPGMFALNLATSVQFLAHVIYVLLSPLFIRELSDPRIISMSNVFGGSVHQMLFFPHVWRMVENKFHAIKGSVAVDPRLSAIFEAEARGASALFPLLSQLKTLMPPAPDEVLRKHTQM